MQYQDLFNALRHMGRMAVVLLGVTAFIGCGGGGDGGGAVPGGGGGGTPATIAGTASKGPIKNATIRVYKIENGEKGNRIGQGTSDGNGQFSIELDEAYDGPVYIEATGGQYTDEATGQDKDLTITMRAAMPGVSGDEVTGCVTPLTELAVRKAGYLNPENISAANEMISQLLGIGGDILSDQPFDPTQAGGGDGTSDAAAVYTMLLAAISEMCDETGQDLEDALKQLEDDLDDNMLDETGDLLQDCLEAFSQSDRNRSGVDADDALDLLKAIAETGFEPTGDLADLKAALLDFMQAPTANHFTALFALFPMVPDTPEASLFAALGELTAVYYSDAADFFRTDLGIDFGMDWDAQEEAMEAYLRGLTNYNTQVQEAVQEINTRLQTVITYLEDAEDAHTSISLTGFDTLYLDGVDVSLLKAMTHMLIAGCCYVESLDLAVGNWIIDGDTDFRDIEKPTDAQQEDFLTANPDLMTYADKGKLLDFRNAVKDALAAYDAAYQALAAMTRDQRDQRVRHAFTPVWGDFGLKMAEALSSETRVSILNALQDHTENLVFPEAEWDTHETVVVADDGYAYWQETHDIVLRTFVPNPLYDDGDYNYSLYDFAHGYLSPRDFMLANMGLSDEVEKDVYMQSGPETVYAEGLTEIQWDEPIDTYTIVESDTIAIDGNADDWAGIRPLVKTDDMTVKLARQNGRLLLFAQAIDGGTIFDTNLSACSFDGCFNANVHNDTPGLVWSAGYSGGTPVETLSGVGDNGVEVEYPTGVLNSLTTAGCYNECYYWHEGYGYRAIKLLPETDSE